MIIKSSFTKSLINFLLPPQCPLCQEIVTEPHTVCGICWPKLKFITIPKCSICSVPLENVDRDMPCTDCLRYPPVFSRAYAPLVYNDSIKKLILRYKNYDGLHLGPMFFSWMRHHIPENVDVIIPVPLHWKRFFTRQYNQANEIGKLLAKHAKITINPNILKRQKATASQGHKNKLSRYENLKDAFLVDKYKNTLSKTNVLLIDDVLTSGATANACAQTLLDAGAAKIDVLTIARAVKETHGKS